MKKRSSFLMLAACGVMLGAAVAVACSDDGGEATTEESPADASTGKDAKPDTRDEPADAAREDAASDAGIADASDASAPPSVTGIWQGVQGDHYQNAWTVLVGLVAGAESAAPGATVGVITYPSLGCGGPLTVIGPDGGADTDAGFSDDRDGGASTVIKRLVAHETDSFNCQDGDDYFSLLSDGTLRLEWRTSPADAVVGNLTRISTPGPSEPLVAVWAEPAIDVNGFHALLAVMTRTDTLGKGSGVFMLRNDNGAEACGGLWTLSQRPNASSLTLTESFPQGQVGCAFDGGVSATMMAVDGGARYVRQIPADAGDAGALSLVKISP